MSPADAGYTLQPKRRASATPYAHIRLAPSKTTVGGSLGGGGGALRAPGARCEKDERAR